MITISKYLCFAHHQRGRKFANILEPYLVSEGIVYVGRMSQFNRVGARCSGM